MYKYLIITKYLLYHIYIILGNPTRLAPIPKPAPPLALEAIDGTNTSRMENVAAAIRPMMTISSIFKAFLGIVYAAMATITPSTKYLMAL